MGKMAVAPRSPSSRHPPQFEIRALYFVVTVRLRAAAPASAVPTILRDRRLRWFTVVQSLTNIRLGILLPSSPPVSPRHHLCRVVASSLPPARNLVCHVPYTQVLYALGFTTTKPVISYMAAQVSSPAGFEQVYLVACWKQVVFLVCS